MQIWIDARALNAAVPDVAEDVGGNRRARQNEAAHGKADDENGRERAAAVRAALPASDDEPSRNGIGHGLQQRGDAGVGVVEGGDPDRAGDRQRQ